jgi:uncharacterized protein (UPF0264 family)
VTGLLASVATVDEMEVVRTGGAAIVDLKEPSAGALGAWRTAALEAAVARWRGWPSPSPLLSATIGDQPMTPSVVAAAAERVAAAGVPMVKLGMFPGGDPLRCLEALAPLAARCDLIAVFFGDAEPDFGLLPAIAEAGFHGAMIDTADKSAGGLRRHMTDAALAAFVTRSRERGLLVGLAGSLKIEDVGPLAALNPDYLGFRGALCAGGRTGRIDARAVAALATALRDRRRAA